MNIHVVEPGDSLYQIASQYGVSMTQLMNDNQLPDPNHLAVGQGLIIRIPQAVYTVVPGDTLSSIARRHDLSVRQLMRNNPALLGGSVLHPGQVLVLCYDHQPTTVVRSYGYAYPSIDPALYRSTLPYLTALAPFTHTISPQGELGSLEDDWMVADAKAGGTLPVLHVSTLLEGKFSNTLAQEMLTSPQAQSTLIAQIVSAVTQEGYRGVASSP